MSTTEFEIETALAKELANQLRLEVAAVTKPLRDKIAEFEARIVEMEKHIAECRYRGAWQPGEQYRKNNTVTYDGSEWRCLRDTEGKPGQSLDWQLAVRKGRDGKDAKAAA